MEKKELTTHQRGVILRGICGGAALKDKSPYISENNTVIICAGDWTSGTFAASAVMPRLSGWKQHSATTEKQK